MFKVKVSDEMFCNYSETCSRADDNSSGFNSESDDDVAANGEEESTTKIAKENSNSEATETPFSGEGNALFLQL